jgi:NAD(P)-dependent dehydrogenase (short-subunit alcohol dehydrogenase family)
VPSENARVAVVTGAGGGIGLATAHRFAEDGYRLVLMDYTGDAAESAGTAVAAEHPEADILTLVCDVTSEESVAAAADRVRTEIGHVHAVALVAGVLQDAAAVVDQTVNVWDRMFDTNARGVFLSAKHFSPLIPDDAGGSITAIASWSGRLGGPYFSAYCASKAAVIVFIQSLAYELAPRGVRANTVAPGNIDTGMHRMALEVEAAARGISFDEMRDIEWAKIPLKAAGPPSSVADAVVFLASDRASYITGESLDVNGGVHMR